MATVSQNVGGERAVPTLRMPRSRGAASGVLIVLLGVWGALVPFVGAHFGYAYTPNETWTMTWGRLWLELIPGAVAILGGLLLIGSANRAVGLTGGWIAAAAGAWFAVGPVVSRLSTGESRAGVPIASSITQAVLEEVGLFIGLGVVIVFLAAVAIGRLSIVGVRDAERVQRATAAPAMAPAAAPVATASPDQPTYQMPRHGVAEERPTDPPA